MSHLEPSSSTASGTGHVAGSGTRTWIWDLVPLLQWSGNYTLLLKCSALWIAVTDSIHTHSKETSGDQSIRTHFLQREFKMHDSGAKQLCCCLKNQCSCPNFPSMCWVGMTLCSPAERKFLSHYFSYKHNEFKLIFSFRCANNMAWRSELSSKEKAKPSNLIRFEIKILITW